MISDILVEALQDIEDYQKTHRGMYQEYIPLLHALKTLMRYVISVLDTDTSDKTEANND